ncbi:hypothetical protein [Streptomyces hydrogenans]
MLREDAAGLDEAGEVGVGAGLVGRRDPEGEGFLVQGQGALGSVGGGRQRRACQDW